MTSNIFATLFNFNKLHMFGIRNPRTARDTRATNYLRINASAHFLVVRESLFNMTMGGGGVAMKVLRGAPKICILYTQKDGGLIKKIEPLARGATKISSFEFQYLHLPPLSC